MNGRYDPRWPAMSLTALADLLSEVMPPKRLIAITVDPGWPRRPIAIVADQDATPSTLSLRGGIEIRRSEFLRPGHALLHYSDGSVGLLPTPKPAGER